MLFKLTFKHALLISALVLLVLLGITSLSLAQADPWTTKSPMPTPRVGCSACEVNGVIYVIGGLIKDDNWDKSVSTVEAYDPATDTWDTTKADMPTPRHHFATCCLNGKIYAIGGSESPYISGEAHNTVEEYDPMTDSWQGKTPMPTKRAYLAACSVDGEIYAFGGKDGSNIPRPEVEAYDATTDTWSTKTPMPTARNYLAACSADGKIYALGGAEGYTSDELPHNESYDPATDNWITRKDMPTARLGLSASSVNGKVYAIGGSDGLFVSAFNTVEEYDPETDYWAPMTDMPTPRAWPTTCAMDGKIYAIGGTKDGKPTGTVATVEVYDPSIDLMPWLKNVDVSKSYAVAGSDSVCITVKMNNPTGITLFAEIEAPDQTPVDSLQLYDDGNHNDGNADDSLYANIWPVRSAEEQHYYVDLQVTRVDTDTVIQHMNNIALFTTIGPVVYDGCTFSTVDTIPNPGDVIVFNLNLRNNSSIATAKNVTAKISSLDSCIVIHLSYSEFEDISPGQSKTSKTRYSFKVASNCNEAKEVPLNISIASNDYEFWSDTLLILIHPTTVVENTNEELPSEFVLCQNYPNPFNPTTTIHYYLPQPTNVKLTIFDLKGNEVRQLINEKKTAGHFSTHWDARDNLGRLAASGVYFYRIEIKGQDVSFVDVKKMILMK